MLATLKKKEMKVLLQPLLIISAIFLINGKLNCQNFAPVNAQWHYQDFRSDCANTFFIKIESDRDTVIEDKLVSVLEVYENSINIPEGRNYIFEENDKVYFYEDNEFKLLYDFTLEAGDTAIVNIPQNRTYYDFSCNNGEFPLVNSKTKVIIDSISFVEIQGQQLKVFHTNVDDNDFDNDCFNFGKITERIGSEWGMFGWNCQQCLVVCIGHLRCYSDNLINYKIVSEDCDFGINSSVSNLSNIKLKVYPNPTASNIIIDSEIEINAYKVYDLNGRLLLEKSNRIENVVNTKSLEFGIYILELFDKKGNLIFVQKIIKN